MEITIFLQYFGLLLAGLMAGSSIFFHVGVISGIEKSSGGSFREVNQIMELPFAEWTYVIYLAFIFTLCLNLFLIRRRWKSLEFMMVVFSLVCVVDDLVMTLAGNLPMVQGLRSWQNTSAENWIEVRSQWSNFMYIRCALLSASFILLLASTYLMTKTKISQKDVVVVA